MNCTGHHPTLKLRMAKQGSERRAYSVKCKENKAEVEV